MEMGIDNGNDVVELNEDSDIEWNTCSISDKRGWCICVDGYDILGDVKHVIISIDFINETLKKFQNAKIIAKS